MRYYRHHRANLIAYDEIKISEIDFSEWKLHKNITGVAIKIK